MDDLNPGTGNTRSDLAPDQPAGTAPEVLILWALSVGHLPWLTWASEPDHLTADWPRRNRHARPIMTSESQREEEG